MKKFIALLLTVLVLICSAGCGKTVTVTVPTDYAGPGYTQEDFDALAESAGYESAILNDDDTVTLTMSEKKHKELMETLADNIHSTFSSMCESETYPNIQSVESNSDFTEITINTTSIEEPSYQEMLAAKMVYVLGMSYNAFNGNPDAVIYLRYVSQPYGILIASGVSSDMNG